MQIIKKLVDLSEEDHDYEVIAYGIDALCSGVFSMGVLLIAGVIFHLLPETVIYIMCNYLLARSTGRYHATTRFRCHVITFILWGITIGCAYWSVAHIPVCFVGITFIISILCIFLWAPVEHPDKPLDCDTRIKNKRKSVLYVMLFGILIIIFWNVDRIISYVFWTNITEIVIAMIIGKEVYGHEQDKGCTDNY
jgi:accessory gene regulator B